MAQDLVVKRVIAALKHAAAKADTANRAATAAAAAADKVEADTEATARAAHGAWESREVFPTRAARDTAIAYSAAAEAMDAAEVSLGLAECLDTIADMLASDDPAIRSAALQALEGTP